MIVAGAFRLCSQTALDVALRNGHTETVKALLAVGARPADVHGKDWLGYSRPLHRGRGALHLTRGVRCGLCRRTALHCASEKGLVELVKALVEKGANVHAKDNQGYGRLLHRG
jgi:ankyrin repeat protein